MSASEVCLQESEVGSESGRSVSRERGWGPPTVGSASRDGWAEPPLDGTTGYGQRAGSTHPTGMHSCSSKVVAAC